MSAPAIGFVQGLRAIAALTVVAWHARLFLEPYGAGTGARLFAPGAALGVDLFFLISGFIMLHTTRGSDGSGAAVADFAIKRITRIWPVWLVALALAVALHWDLAFVSDPAKRSWLLHSVFLLPSSIGPPLYGAPVLAVGWTLTYEMYFYFVFGGAMRFRRWRWLAFAAWIVATLIVVPAALGSLHVGNAGDVLAPNNGYAFRWPMLGVVTNGLILFFVAGVALGALYHSNRFRVDRRLAMAFAIAATLAVGAQYVTHFRTYHGIANWGLSLVPLLLALVLLDRERPLRWPRALLWLGDISFSLYLFHPLVQDAYALLARRFVPALADGVAALAISTAASIAVAAVAQRVLERGLGDALRNALHRMVLGGPATSRAAAAETR